MSTAATTIPTTSVALQITERKQTTPLTLSRLTIPPLEPNELLIGNVAVAQAPGDVGMVDNDIRPLMPTLPHTNGWETSGVVLAVGDDVKGFQVGDRVASMAAATKPHTASYQENTVVYDFLTAKIPSSLTHEEACAIPLPFATAFAGVYALGVLPSGALSELPLPPKPNSTPPILVWGAASSVGAMAVQLFKLAGYRVIGTCSPENFEYVKRIGAEFVVDYKEGENAVEEIKRVSEGGVNFVYDAVSKPESIPLGIKCIGTHGGKLMVVKPGLDKTTDAGRADVEVLYAGGYDLLKPELRPSFGLLERLLAQNALVLHTTEVMPHGLKSVDEGWRRHRANEVRFLFITSPVEFELLMKRSAVQIGSKVLVYRPADTPGLSDI
ncbi:hypothetical protein RQP46_009956 [Phenoliferia psychrophenolica]